VGVAQPDQGSRITAKPLRTMNTTRCQILTLLIFVGLVVPTMPVAAGHSCWGDSCSLHVRQTPQSCCDAEQQVEPCAQDQDDDCCSSGGCDCICCGAAVVTALLRSTPVQVTIAPRAVSIAICRSTLSPQDAVGALLRPPRS
jgi:hypothetical protein